MKLGLQRNSSSLSIPPGHRPPPSPHLLAGPLLSACLQKQLPPHPWAVERACYSSPVILRQNIFLFDICLAEVVPEHSLLGQEIIAPLLSKCLTICFISSPVPEQYTIIMRHFSFLSQEICYKRLRAVVTAAMPWEFRGGGSPNNYRRRAACLDSAVTWRVGRALVR